MDERTKLKRSELSDAESFYDLMKHLATLSTALLAVFGAFATKFAADGRARWTLTVAVALFLACALTSTVCMLFKVSLQRYESRPPEREEFTIKLSFVLAAATFMAGIIAVSVFAFANL